MVAATQFTWLVRCLVTLPVTRFVLYHCRLLDSGLPFTFYTVYTWFTHTPHSCVAPFTLGLHHGLRTHGCAFCRTGSWLVYRIALLPAAHTTLRGCVARCGFTRTHCSFATGCYRFVPPYPLQFPFATFVLLRVHICWLGLVRCLRLHLRYHHYITHCLRSWFTHTTALPRTAVTGYHWLDYACLPRFGCTVGYTTGSGYGLRRFAVTQFTAARLPFATFGWLLLPGCCARHAVTIRGSPHVHGLDCGYAPRLRFAVYTALRSYTALPFRCLRLRGCCVPGYCLGCCCVARVRRTVAVCRTHRLSAVTTVVPRSPTVPVTGSLPHLRPALRLYTLHTCGSTRSAGSAHTVAVYRYAFVLCRLAGYVYHTCLYVYLPGSFTGCHGSTVISTWFTPAVYTPHATCRYLRFFTFLRGYVLAPYGCWFWMRYRWLGYTWLFAVAVGYPHRSPYIAVLPLRTFTGYTFCVTAFTRLPTHGLHTGYCYLCWFVTANAVTTPHGCGYAVARSLRLLRYRSALLHTTRWLLVAVVTVGFTHAFAFAVTTRFVTFTVGCYYRLLFCTFDATPHALLHSRRSPHYVYVLATHLVLVAAFHTVAVLRLVLPLPHVTHCRSVTLRYVLPDYTLGLRVLPRCAGSYVLPRLCTLPPHAVTGYTSRFWFAVVRTAYTGLRIGCCPLPVHTQRSAFTGWLRLRFATGLYTFYSLPVTTLRLPHCLPLRLLPCSSHSCLLHTFMRITRLRFGCICLLHGSFTTVVLLHLTRLLVIYRRVLRSVRGLVRFAPHAVLHAFAVTVLVRTFARCRLPSAVWVTAVTYSSACGCRATHTTLVTVVVLLRLPHIPVRSRFCYIYSYTTRGYRTHATRFTRLPRLPATFGSRCLPHTVYGFTPRYHVPGYHLPHRILRFCPTPVPGSPPTYTTQLRMPAVGCGSLPVVPLPVAPPLPYRYLPRFCGYHG